MTIYTDIFIINTVNIPRSWLFEGNGNLNVFKDPYML